MKTLSCGCDLIEIGRISRALTRYGKRFLSRLFTPEEQRYCEAYKAHPSQHYAGRFAGKEAVIKALGSIGLKIYPLEIEILPGKSGEPLVTLNPDHSPQKFQGLSLQLSISHCKEYAMAMALLFGEDRSLREDM